MFGHYVKPGHLLPQQVSANTVIHTIDFLLIWRRVLQVRVTQAEFEAIALAQVTELWSRFGNLTEIWFDGGYTRCDARIHQMWSTTSDHVAD